MCSVGCDSMCLYSETRVCSVGCDSMCLHCEARVCSVGCDSGPVHTGENNPVLFYAVQEYLRKDGIIAKPHRAVETL